MAASDGSGKRTLVVVSFYAGRDDVRGWELLLRGQVSDVEPCSSSLKDDSLPAREEISRAAQHLRSPSRPQGPSQPAGIGAVIGARTASNDSCVIGLGLESPHRTGKSRKPHARADLGARDFDHAR